MEIITVDEEDQESDNNYWNCLPPGISFQPTDQQLISEYLMKKILRQPLPRNRIHQVDLYKHHPYDLCQKYELKREKEWFFFTSRDKKYTNGSRPNRIAGNGYWRATGADIDIKSNGKSIGLKKTLVYYEGKAKNQKGVKTNWIMHEFRIDDKKIKAAPSPSTKNKNLGDVNMTLDKWVLCRIYHRQPSKSKNKEEQDILDQDLHILPQTNDQNSAFTEYADNQIPQPRPITTIPYQVQQQLQVPHMFQPDYSVPCNMNQFLDSSAGPSSGPSTYQDVHMDQIQYGVAGPSFGPLSNQDEHMDQFQVSIPGPSYGPLREQDVHMDQFQKSITGPSSGPLNYQDMHMDQFQESILRPSSGPLSNQDEWLQPEDLADGFKLIDDLLQSLQSRITS